MAPTTNRITDSSMSASLVSSPSKAWHFIAVLMALFYFHSPLTFRCFFVHQKPICLSVYVTELVCLFFFLGGNRATHSERDDFLAKNEGRYGVLRGSKFFLSLGSYGDSRIESQRLGRSGSGGRGKMRREEWEDGLCKKTGTLLLHYF
jgi:hypothetical protein